VGDTIGVILKYQDDIELMSPETLQAIYDRAKLEAERVRA
jgi:hypothetical protein